MIALKIGRTVGEQDDNGIDTAAGQKLNRTLQIASQSHN